MKIGLVVTTIQAPNPVMQALAAQAQANQAEFVVIGDRKSPPVFELEGADYYDLARQNQVLPEFSQALPVGHYARKNLGYLLALQRGCDWLVETDDDNFPLDNFFSLVRGDELRARRLRSESRWLNAYRYFSPSEPVWPRGYPLEKLAEDLPGKASEQWELERPVLVQGLADDNPDVDAVYRLTRPLPVNFDRQAAAISLESGLWCPFNSQNTWFRRDVATLCYLPSYCSFRMTDIWRSFVAQRCLWALGERLIFTAPSVRQERNEHNLLRDFADEVPGYLNNERIVGALDACALKGEVRGDLRRCYEALVTLGVIPEKELALVDLWLAGLPT